MKNLLEDPDVYQLYLDLKKKNSDINNTSLENNSLQKKEHHTKIFFDGKEVSDFIGDNEYGL